MCAARINHSLGKIKSRAGNGTLRWDQCKNGEAGDPRNRLPLSQLVSPLEKGGPSEGTEYMPGPSIWQQFLQAIFVKVAGQNCLENRAHWAQLRLIPNPDYNT